VSNTRALCGLGQYCAVSTNLNSRRTRYAIHLQSRSWPRPGSTVVIEATDQQRAGLRACGCVVVALAVELGLHRVKKTTIEDGSSPWSVDTRV